MALALAAFVPLVLRHRRLRDLADTLEALVQVALDGERRVRRNWDALPSALDVRVPPNHPFATDLDVVGRGSLLRLLGTTTRAPGGATLADWLLAPTAEAHAIRARQQAVVDLRDRVALREELAALARRARGIGPVEVERLRAWGEGAPWLVHARLLRLFAWLVPVALLLAFVLGAAGAVSPQIWILPVLLGAAATLSRRRRLADTIASASARTGARWLGDIAALLADAPMASPLGHDLRRRLEAHGGAARQFRRLARVLAWADVRYSPMLHVALQWTLLWDVHVVAALERWQRAAGPAVGDWLAAIGEGEALAALATLAHDNPEWSIPEFAVAGTEPELDAVALGHPLLPASVRIANDVRVGPPGTLLVVTGSNMSGKSTLLRAIGLGVVLAHAGGPVCATRLRLPLVRLWTSIRIEDSLERGVSLFMAELERLKQIVDAARVVVPARGPVLYLLDEILHGTNTAERRVAARAVLGHLVRAGAIGAVTTHDLALAAAGELVGAARHVHFTDAVRPTRGGVEISFDYRLRPGIATSTNALRLLQAVGLADGAAEAPSDVESSSAD